MGYMALVAIIGTTILVPSYVIKSLQLIWRSGTRTSHLFIANFGRHAYYVAYYFVVIYLQGNNVSWLCFVEDMFYFNLFITVLFKAV